MEQLTWSQLGLHAKPVGLLDVEEYWRPLVGLARHATEEGFVREVDLAAIAVAADAEGLLDRLERLTREAAAAAEVVEPARAVDLGELRSIRTARRRRVPPRPGAATIAQTSGERSLQGGVADRRTDPARGIRSASARCRHRTACERP